MVFLSCEGFSYEGLNEFFMVCSKMLEFGCYGFGIKLIVLYILVKVLVVCVDVFLVFWCIMLLRYVLFVWILV